YINYKEINHIKHYYSDIIQYEGNHYDFGFEQGKLLRDSPMLNNRKKQNENTRRRHFIINEQEAIDLFNKHHPSMLDELRGLADAPAREMSDAYRELGGSCVDYSSSSW